MNRSSLIAGLLLVLVLALAGAVQSVNFHDPVRSAAEDQIHSLPGLEQPAFKHYSGYLNADDSKNRFWHYWFVESRSEPATDPLVLWLNGGPGCSSLLGLLTELGPFRVDPNGTLTANPFAWNKRANVLFVESPAGVGFSYAANSDVKADDDTTANQNLRALRSFLAKFPQFKANPLYLTGESYGGVYLPTLAVLVDKEQDLNLKGVAIGNGYLDANKITESLVYFNYYHGLVGQHTWRGLSRHCCGGQPPARGQCHFSHSRSKDCEPYVVEATDRIIQSGLNPYNLYDQCAMAGSSSSREHFDKSLLLSAFNSTRRGFSSLRPTSAGRRFQLTSGRLRGDPPCTDDSLVINYLNRAEVKRALHIPEELKTAFTSCFEGIQYTMIYPSRPDGLAPQVRSLIDSARNLTLLVYNGDVDLMCNFFGDEWFVDDLGREVVRDYEPWHTDGQVSGFAKYYNGIAFFTVKGSGHMVPTDRPAEALHMFEMFLDGLRPTS